MKKLFLILMVVALSVGASAQNYLTKDYTGKYVGTKIKAVAVHHTDTSGTFQLGGDISGFNLIGMVTGATTNTAKLSFLVQSAVTYNASQASMSWVTVDSIVGGTASAVKTFTGAYPYVRVIRAVWQPAAAVSITSGVYLQPYGAK